MPLARIITRTPQDAVGASEYLRSLGYTVETVSPEEFRITPAELELNLDRCGPAEAVERAFALVESGASAAPKIEAPEAPEPAPPQKAKIPIAYDITGTPVEFADDEEIDSRQNPGGLGQALASMFGRVGNSLRQPWRGFRQRRAEQRALKLEAEAARQQEDARREEELARERLHQETERQREAVELAERRRQEQLAAEQQEQERMPVLHEAMIVADAETAPQQPPPQIPTPEAVPVVAAEAASDHLTVLPAPAELAPERRQVPRQPQRPVQLRRAHAPIAISRTAVVTACGLSLLLIMGFVAYANRRPALPLPAGALTNVKQDVPFGPATITPSVAATQRSGVAPAGKRSAGVRPASRKPSAGQPGARRSSRDDAQDEVVVRPLQPAPPKPQPQPSTAKLKRHSDLD